MTLFSGRSVDVSKKYIFGFEFDFFDLLAFVMARLRNMPANLCQSWASPQSKSILLIFVKPHKAESLKSYNNCPELERY